MTHLLDSTALLAFILDEEEADAVEHLMFDQACAVSFATWIEVHGRLRSLGLPAEDVASQLGDARALPLVTLWAYGATLEKALEIKEGGYFPFADTLIAATAWALGLVLVHKDSHFTALPSVVRQLDLRSIPK